MSDIQNTSSQSSQPEEHLENIIDEEEKSNEPEATSHWTLKAYVKSIFIMLVIGFIIDNAYYINNESQRAVETRFGKLIRITGPGICLKLPFIESYQQYPVDKQKQSYKSVSTASSDNYTLYGKVVLEYSMPEDQLEYIHRNVPKKNFYHYLEDIKTSISKYLDPKNQDNFDRYLKDIVTSTFKNEIGKISMEDVPNDKKGRKELEDKILEPIKTKARDLLKIEVHSFRIPYYGWSQGYLLSVEKTEDNEAGLKAAEWAKNRTQEIANNETEKADKKIEGADKEVLLNTVQAQAKADLKKIKAQAEAEAKLTTAKAEAYAIRKKGEAQAKVQKAQAQVLAENPHLIESEKIKRWDGKLPSYFLNQGISPFMSPISKGTLPIQSQ